MSELKTSSQREGCGVTLKMPRVFTNDIPATMPRVVTNDITLKMPRVVSDTTHFEYPKSRYHLLQSDSISEAVKGCVCVSECVCMHACMYVCL